MHGVMLCVGYSAASWVGLGFYFVDAGGAQWRLPLAIQAVWPAVLSAGVLFLPETPRWCMFFLNRVKKQKSRHPLYSRLTQWK